MGERRMFHTAVVGSDAFMDMPAGAQALYFHLGMQADDDGFVNGPKQVARRLRRPPRELQLLVERGFLLDFDGIVVLRHWLVANTLKADRMKPLNYPHIAQKIYVVPNREYVLEPQGKSKSLLSMRKEKLESKRNPKVREGNVNQEKPRKTKEKCEDNEGSVAEENTAPDVPGDFSAAAETDSVMRYLNGKLGKGVVLLSNQQITDLLERMDIDGFDHYVEKLADFILRKQVSVKNHYATILKWWQEDKGVLQ